MTISDFFRSQLAVWPDAESRFAALEGVEVRQLGSLSVQYNPARMVSTGAKVDKAAIAHRPCFLCKQNRPAVQQELPFEEGFEVLVNPFPILPKHVTVPARRHRPQTILDNYGTLFRLASCYEGLLFFYNGPKCGASAPDHLHFQGGDGSAVPLVRDWEKWSAGLREVARLDAESTLSTIEGYPFPTLVISSCDEEKAASLFRRVCAALPCRHDDTEPMMNVLAWKADGKVITVVLPREKHRPACYNAADESQMLISPGALDMAGLVITPRKEDFERLTADRLVSVVGEVALSADAFERVLHRLREPVVSVGIVSAESIDFVLHGVFLADGGRWEGSQRVTASQGKLQWNGLAYDALTFTPGEGSSTFTLAEVTIGVGFHWERKEEQRFEGMLRFLPDGDKVLVVNELPVERYLCSVISSEMRATSSLSLLQAHAVISRSWLLAQMAGRYGHNATEDHCEHGWETEEERVRWYDSEAHNRFDVCADDHCQRYQGVTRVVSDCVAEAVRSTYGQVLWSDEAICDARFSKCCGGVTEQFSACWQDEDKPYLVALADVADDACGHRAPLPALSGEEAARWWIQGSPDAFCNTQDKQTLAQVLNGYDQETADFYRWSVDYAQEELRCLIESKTGLKFGQIVDLVPLSRGKSGRIVRLRIVGTERTLVVGKELEIRRVLSESHLKSSAFVVDKQEVVAGIPQRFHLAGAGWGHGVGLCQIGAAVMGAQGYDYAAILRHYYPGATLRTMYEPSESETK